MPSLNALRAFEAAARLGGFALAAQELSVSPGAVAQHIKALEDWVGAPLFDRRSHGVTLTHIGLDAQDNFTSAFNALSQAAIDLRTSAAPNDIHIATLPAIAQLWLSPRIPVLRQRFPDSQISVTALETPPNLDRDDYDLSIFFRPKQSLSNEIVHLADDKVFPVCAPQIAATLKAPQDLSDLTRLIDSTWDADWQDWLDHLPAETPRPGRMRQAHFSLYSLALNEACQGAGVMIGHATLVNDALRNGQLTAPFGDLTLETGYALSAEIGQGKTAKLARKIAAALHALP